MYSDFGISVSELIGYQVISTVSLGDTELAYSLADYMDPPPVTGYKQPVLWACNRQKPFIIYVNSRGLPPFTQ